MKLDEKKKLYGEASPITLGEMMLYYDCTALATLKKYDEVIDVSKAFITAYPTSLYFSGIKMHLEQAIKELEKKENGKKGIEIKLSSESLDAYLNYLNKLEWKSNLQFVDEKEYKRYAQLYKANVLNINREVLAAWDESGKFNEFTEFFDVAIHFNDTKTMEEIVKVCKQLFTETDDQDRVFRLENKLEDFKISSLENEEKIKELEAVSKKGTKEELEKIIRSLYSKEKFNRSDLLIAICDRYIKDFKPSNENESGLQLDAWDALISNTAKSKSLDDAKKLAETFKSKADDFKINKVSYDKKIREINQDINGLQNDYVNYQKYLKNNDPMVGVLENYAKIYNENQPFCVFSDIEQDPRAFMVSVTYQAQGFGILKSSEDEDAKSSSSDT